MTLKSIQIKWKAPELSDEVGEYFENEYTKVAMKYWGLSFNDDDTLLSYLSLGQLQPLKLENYQKSKLENFTIDLKEFDEELLEPSYKQSFSNMENELLSKGYINLPAPIVLQLPKGNIYGFSGNRRTNLARKYNLPLVVWMVPYPEVTLKEYKIFS